MDSIKKLPDSELEIMLLIWEAKEKVTSDYLLERLVKTWRKTTVLNFLSRLCERGFLKVYKEGRNNIYEPLVAKEDYLQKESRAFLRKIHKNSLKSLMASLYDGQTISGKDLDALRKFIKEAE